MSSGWFFVILCALVKIDSKAEINVFIDDVEIDEIDSTYFDVEKTNSYVTDNGTIAVTLSIVKKFPEGTECLFRLLGRMRGKYVQSTGLDYTSGICDAFEEPIILGPFFNTIGFSIDSCPPEPADYINLDYDLPLENLPDSFPDNKYVLILGFFNGGKTLIRESIYVDIQSAR